MTVLLSIKPEFANKIFAGEKKYEYRRSIFKRQDVRKIIVYASSPIRKVIGEFTIDSILNDKVENVWKKTASSSGISKNFYLDYFENKDRAYAIKIGQVVRYKKEKELKDYDIQVAPQSFAYLNIQ